MPRGVPTSGKPMRKNVPDGTPIPSMVHYDPNPEALVQPAYDEIDQLFDDLRELKSNKKAAKKAKAEQAIQKGASAIDSMTSPTDDGPFFC